MPISDFLSICAGFYLRLTSSRNCRGLVSVLGQFYAHTLDLHQRRIATVSCWPTLLDVYGVFSNLTSTVRHSADCSAGWWLLTDDHPRSWSAGLTEWQWQVLKRFIWYTLLVITHADGSRVSIAIMRLKANSVCLQLCPHDKTKTSETKIAKLCIQIVHHDTSPTNEY